LRALTEAFAAGRLPELVVTDVMMPRMDGKALFREARLLLAEACPPFIFLTARGEADERREAFVEGAVDYLGKPFDLDELALKIESLLAMRSQDREFARRGMKEALAKYLEDAGGSRVAAPKAAEARRAEILRRLTAREAEVALLASRGLQDKQIAKELKLAPRTVSNTLLRVYRKLGVENRLELMREIGPVEK